MPAYLSESGNEVLVNEATSKFFWKRFKRGQKVGSGGFATVYKAIDTRDNNRVVALKIFNHKRRESFFNEKVLLDRLKNVPHVIQLYSAWAINSSSDSNAQYVIVMQLFEGEAANRLKLASYERHHILRIAEQGAQALKLIHQRGIIHGDVKLDNILYSKKTGAVIIDFGVSCLGLDVGESRKVGAVRARCEESGAVLGTHFYFSLDRWRVILAIRNKLKDKAVSLETYFKIMRKDDMFAFGIALYELTMGRRYRAPAFVSVPKYYAQVMELLKIPESMTPNGWMGMQTNLLFKVVLELLTASYTQRPTATETLRMIKVVLRSGGTSSASSSVASSAVVGKSSRSSNSSSLWGSTDTPSSWESWNKRLR